MKLGVLPLVEGGMALVDVAGMLTGSSGVPRWLLALALALALPAPVPVPGEAAAAAGAGFGDVGDVGELIPEPAYAKRLELPVAATFRLPAPGLSVPLPPSGILGCDGDSS